MAGTRDQTARIVAADGEAADLRPAPASLRAPQDEATPRPVPPPAGDEPLTPEDIAALAGKPKPGKRKLIGLGVAAVLALAAGGFGVNYLMVGRFLVTTDDAYVGANNTTLAAKVSGYIATVSRRRQRPGPGRRRHRAIDDGDYRLAVQTAQDQIATQQATIDRIGKQIDGASRRAVDQAKAQLASAKAGADARRARAQAPAGARHAQIHQPRSARAGAGQPRPGRRRRAGARRPRIEAAHANVDVLQGAAGGGQRARSKQFKTSARQGRARSVLHRDPRAVRRRRRQPRRAGRRLRAAGPAARQPRAARRRLRRRQLQGDAARAAAAGPAGGDRVDACPAATIEGTVASFAPASGSVFSLLPPDNATGNFTKIVQRVPVRIRVPADVAEQARAAPRHVGGRQRRHQAGAPPAAQTGAAPRRYEPSRPHGHGRRRNSTAAPRWRPRRRRGRAGPHRAAPARRLPGHGVRHVHGDPGHPDRLGLADRDPGRPLRLRATRSPGCRPPT